MSFRPRIVSAGYANRKWFVRTHAARDIASGTPPSGATGGACGIFCHVQELAQAAISYNKSVIYATPANRPGDL